MLIIEFRHFLLVILFAYNELLHPGEKRLITYAKQNCKVLPVDFEKNIQSLLEEPDLKKLDKIIGNL